MKKSIKTLLLVAALGLGLSSRASAVSVSYDLVFLGAASGSGSGTLTLDDTITGPLQFLAPPATHYDFTGVVGTGAAGSWTSAFFEYNATSGQARFELSIGLGTTLTINPGSPTGLDVFSAFEANLSAPQIRELVSLTRKPSTGVPDGGSTGLLIALALGGLGLIRKRLR